ncbi:MAG: hypothetical protein H6837_09115 [Planctomycetes bacterium]|nr:hypothetical protein [Planctomycetota bacterium]
MRPTTRLCTLLLLGCLLAGCQTPQAAVELLGRPLQRLSRSTQRILGSELLRPVALRHALLPWHQEISGRPTRIREGSTALLSNAIGRLREIPKSVKAAFSWLGFDRLPALGKKIESGRLLR